MQRFMLGFVGTLLIAGAASARADYATYSFYNITGNNLADAAIGEAQLFVEVWDMGDQVRFHFFNTGPEASSITDLYFDDGSLLGIAYIDSGDQPGVAFSESASPPDLPGGNGITPPFETTVGFLADSDPPTQPNGVNPDEWVDIVFDLQDGAGFNDVIGQLGSGALRIGMHVQGFEGGGSESFVNEIQVIPAPGAAVLGAIGLAMVRWVKRQLS